MQVKPVYDKIHAEQTLKGHYRMKSSEKDTKKQKENNNTKSRKIIKRIIKILIVVIIIELLIFQGARMYFRIPVSEYYKNSEEAFVIPDIGDGFIAQGLAYDERSECFFITGYMNDKSASPIYIVEKSSGLCLNKLSMKNADGSDFHGHAGGLTIHGDYIYVAGSGDSCLYVFSYDTAINSEKNDTITCLGSFPMAENMSVAYTSSDSDSIYAGEFYREANYQTPENHKMTTKAGDYNQAIIQRYRFSDSEDAVFGIETIPFEIYSVTDLVQGMDVYKGKIYLSTSYAVAFSHIFIYEKPQSTSTFNIAGKDIPLYELDSASLKDDLKIPPMAEEIVFTDGKMYTMCESASNKYIFGKLTSAKWCYATKIED